MSSSAIKPHSPKKKSIKRKTIIENNKTERRVDTEEDVVDKVTETEDKGQEVEIKEASRILF